MSGAVRFSVTVPEGLDQALRAEAERLGTTRASLATRLLAEALEGGPSGPEAPLVVLEALEAVAKELARLSSVVEMGDRDLARFQAGMADVAEALMERLATEPAPAWPKAKVKPFVMETLRRKRRGK